MPELFAPLLGLGAADAAIDFGPLIGTLPSVSAASFGLDALAPAVAAGAGAAAAPDFLGGGLSSIPSGVVDTAGTFGTDIAGTGASFGGALGPFADTAVSIPLNVAGGALGPSVGLGTDLGAALPAASLSDIAGGFPGATLAASTGDIGAFGASTALGFPEAGALGAGIDPFAALPGVGTDPFAGTSLAGESFGGTTTIPETFGGTTTVPETFGTASTPSDVISSDFSNLTPGPTANQVVGQDFSDLPPTSTDFQTQVELQQMGLNNQIADQSLFNQPLNVVPPNTQLPQLSLGPTGQLPPAGTLDVAGAPQLPSPATIEDTATSLGTPTAAVPGETLPGVPTGGGATSFASDLPVPSEVAAPGGLPFNNPPFNITPATPAGATGATTAAGAGGLFSAGNMQLASLGLGAAGLGMAVIRNLRALPEQAQLNAIAQQIASNSAQAQQQAQALINPLLTGNLPPNLAQQVIQAQQDGITQIKARFASMGQSGSSAEIGAIAQAIQQTAVVSGQLEQQLATAGIQLTQQATTGLNIESTIFQSLMNAQLNSDAALAQAIANFAGQSAIASALSTRKAA